MKLLKWLGMCVLFNCTLSAILIFSADYVTYMATLLKADARYVSQIFNWGLIFGVLLWLTGAALFRHLIKLWKKS